VFIRHSVFIVTRDQHYAKEAVETQIVAGEIDLWAAVRCVRSALVLIVLAELSNWHAFHNTTRRSRDITLTHWP
jgi:hypothetical protein